MPPASFRPHLTMDPLPLAVCLLWSYRTRDFHPLDYTHAGRTPPKPQRGLSIRRLSGFRRQRRQKKKKKKMAPHRAPYLASGHGQPTIGKTFNGQAKDLLWLTWRSYAGPPQYYIPPEGGVLNLPVRRSRSQAEPWQPRAVRPGGCLNPRPQGVNLSSAARLACFPTGESPVVRFSPPKAA